MRLKAYKCSLQGFGKLDLGSLFYVQLFNIEKCFMKKSILLSVYLSVTVFAFSQNSLTIHELFEMNNYSGAEFATYIKVKKFFRDSLESSKSAEITTYLNDAGEKLLVIKNASERLIIYSSKTFKDFNEVRECLKGKGFTPKKSYKGNENLFIKGNEKVKLFFSDGTNEGSMYPVYEITIQKLIDISFYNNGDR